MMIDNPDTYLSEYCQSLKQRWGVDVSEARISQIFTEMNISRKKVPIPSTSTHFWGFF
jgi:hypothetical protein